MSTELVEPDWSELVPADDAEDACREWQIIRKTGIDPQGIFGDFGQEHVHAIARLVFWRIVFNRAAGRMARSENRHDDLIVLRDASRECLALERLLFAEDA